MERLESILNMMKEAIDNDSVFTFMNLMDELEELQGEQFMTVILERFAKTIPEDSLIAEMVKACNEPEETQGGEN